jgi:hypothetical protein
MSCFGDGKCMTLCNRTYCLKLHETSKYKFCKTECKNQCELIPCKNYTHCKSAFPAYFYKEKNSFITNGACNICGIIDITFSKEKRECLLCSEVKYMVVTKCHHEFCYDCIFNIEDTNCPICGREIDAI